MHSILLYIFKSIDKNIKCKCIKCKKCLRNCPMNVDMHDNKRSRKNSTECILCMKHIDECSKKALHL